MKKVKNLFRRVIYRITRLLIKVFVLQKSNRIVFIQESTSGSNTYALYKQADRNIRSEYDLVLLLGLPLNHSLIDFIKWYKIVASSRIIFTTHISEKPSKNHIHFQLWHGNGTKKMGVMEHGINHVFKASSSWLNVDFIMSYSETYTTFLNACMVTDPKKYIITGAPRNDLLISSDGIEYLKNIFGEDVSKSKIIWFAPTFRDYFGQSQGNKSFENPFGFKSFCIKEFDDFLERFKLKIILKPHPQEEELIIQYFEDYQVKNMLILKSVDLNNSGIDFYEILNAGDMLITDYSSLFYDFLLLNKPILFTPVDVEKYEEDRGFLIESYLDYVPGSVILDQDELMYAVKKNLLDLEDDFILRREWMLKFFHRYHDDNSSKRIFDFIKNLK